MNKMLLVCVLLIGVFFPRYGTAQNATHNIDVDSQYGGDEWNLMSKEERTTVVAYYLMGKLSTAEASCSRRFPEEEHANRSSGPDTERFTKLCREVEGVSQIHVARRGDITSEAARMCSLIDQWYRMFPQRQRVPFLPLVDEIAREPIRSAVDLDARFNSKPYLR
jgi:hypothetical protein